MCAEHCYAPTTFRNNSLYLLAGCCPVKVEERRKTARFHPNQTSRLENTLLRSQSSGKSPNISMSTTFVCGFNCISQATNTKHNLFTWLFFIHDNYIYLQCWYTHRNANEREPQPFLKELCTRMALFFRCRSDDRWNLLSVSIYFHCLGKYAAFYFFIIINIKITLSYLIWNQLCINILSFFFLLLRNLHYANVIGAKKLLRRRFFFLSLRLFYWRMCLSRVAIASLSSRFNFKFNSFQ